MALPTPPTLPDESLFSTPPGDSLPLGERTCTALDNFQNFLSGPFMIRRNETIRVEPKPAGQFWDPPDNVQYDGPNTLTDPGWSCFRPTAAAEALIAAPGRRIDPSIHTPYMPTLRQGNWVSGPWVIRNPTQGIRIIGFQLLARQTPNSGCLALGAFGSGESSRFIVDRCLLRGLYQTNHMECAITSGAYDVRIINSWWDRWQASGPGDNPGIKVAASRGYYLVENNYAACCLFFAGGSGAMGDELHMPKHLIFRRNTVETPRFVMGFPIAGEPGYFAGSPGNGSLGRAPEYVGSGETGWNIKAQLELKAAQYVLIEGNTFINGWNTPLWLDAWEQDGAGAEPYNRLEDITMRYNLCPPRDALGYGVGLFFQLFVGNKPIHRVHVHDNLAWNYYTRYGHDQFGYQEGNAIFLIPGPYKANGAPRFPQTLDQTFESISDVNMEHNTFFSDRGGIMVQSAPQIARIRFANNILGYGHGGLQSDADWNNVTDAFWDARIAERTVTRNAFVDTGDAVGGGRTEQYTQAWWDARATPGQWMIAGTPAAAGIDATTGRLTGGSALAAGGLYAASEPSTDNGVRFAAFDAARAGESPPINQPPTCTIQTPTTSATYATSQSPLALAGIAADDLAVTSVTWANSVGGSGIASGSTAWSIPSVTLTAGVNVITVTAHDIGDLTGYDDLTVTYTPPPVSNVATVLPIATVTPVATVAPARVP